MKCYLTSQLRTEHSDIVQSVFAGYKIKSNSLKKQESAQHVYKNLLAHYEKVFCQRRYKRKLIKYLEFDGEFGAEQCTKGHTQLVRSWLLGLNACTSTCFVAQLPIMSHKTLQFWSLFTTFEGYNL